MKMKVQIDKLYSKKYKNKSRKENKEKKLFSF